MSDEKPLILFIDAYDSFSNNIVSLLETTIEVSVRTVKIDDPLLASGTALCDELRHYTAVVCGPGPGHPENNEDVGIIRQIWELYSIPVLGICLGFQSLCLRFGFGEVGRLKGPQHGMIRKITHVGESVRGKNSIFEGVGEIQATLYQSLCADIGHNSMSADTFQKEKWNATEKCPDLLPLAWAEWDGNGDNDSGMKDDRILVAVRHVIKPFWALQYHPESICTNKESHKVIKNWFQHAKRWNRMQHFVQDQPRGPLIGRPAVRQSLLSQHDEASSFATQCHATSGPGQLATFQESQFIEVCDEQNRLNEVLSLHVDDVYKCHTIKLPDYMNVPDIVEALQDSRRDKIILDSSNSHELSADVRGRYSIIALDVEDCLRFDYTTRSNDYERECIRASYPLSEGGYVCQTLDLKSSGGVWPFLAQFLQKRQISGGDPESPFWGGFMGYTTYEMGLKGIDVQSQSRTKNHTHPDLSLAWVTRSLVLDHEKRLIYIQDLSKEGSDGYIPQWMVIAVMKLSSLSLPRAPYLVNSTISRSISRRTSEDNGASSSSSISHLHASASTDSLGSPSLAESTESSPERISHQSLVVSIKSPTNTDYESKVQHCQEYIRSGDSYELCLTDQTTVQCHRVDQTSDDRVAKYLADKHRQPSKPTDGDSWSLYRTLRARQPAPFASFIRLGEATLVSSSPERFLKWSADGHCELRPMKGTVRKSPQVSTLAQAKALLDVPKEKAENLMIVDLVRHDLHSVCGSGNVSVPRLMVVEEYKSVFQMISIVRGVIPPPPESPTPNGWVRDMRGRHTGLDVLAASLPPGSMTGAPKKRSCEILQEIEGKERSLYSGVVGYMDVGGRGDWSVTIRSMFRWDDEDLPMDEDGGKQGMIETWHIGAGGAVTTLSTPEGEREEMLTKLNGTLGIFR